MLGISMTVVWLIAAVVFAITEAATISLTAIWFSAGSLVAMVTAMLNGPVWLQIVLFIVVSGVVLYLTRSWSQKYLNNRHQKTNADRVVGMEGVVILPIDNNQGQGQIRVAGQVWTARGLEESVIEQDIRVTVAAIEGVKAMVVRAQPAAGPQGQEADPL